MSSHSGKGAFFFLEGLNAFATSFYFNYLFFFTQKQMHFGGLENLALVLGHGLIYTGAAWFGGWFSHRIGRFPSLKVGFFLMGIALLLGIFPVGAAVQVGVVLIWTFGMCFTWPTLQSFISDGEPQSRLPKLAGIYNVVWAGVSAVSFFIGGTLLEKLGIKSMFWIPAIIHLFQWILVVRLEKNSKLLKPTEVVHEPVPAIAPSPKQKQFLRLALLANPVAYVAINTAIPLIPDLAKRFELTPMWAGFICSLWFFVRVGAFVLFWLWPGWHYRFRWLLVAKLLLVASFLAMLRANALWVLMLAQIGFGVSVGLIYYSSLFYSMDGGAAKSEHGGAHEAMIGFGTFIGAAVGVGARYYFPQIPGVSVFAVSGLLLFGFIGLVALRLRKA